MYPHSIQKLIVLFSKFPTVGPRVASRFVFYLLRQNKEEVGKLLEAISELKKNIKTCDLCFNPFEDGGEFCNICSDTSRDRTLLCIVTNEIDLLAIEKIKKYRGLYFILGGTVSTLKKEDIKKLRIPELEARIKNLPLLQEIIIATNLTTEGEATALYLERLLNPLNKKISRLGRGLPVGGELEYADEETLGAALEGRK